MNDRSARHLADLTWPEVEQLSGATLVVPLGSFEQHGPHLPLDTDARIAVALTVRAAAGLDHVAIGPTITVAASGEHQGFAGTLSIGTDCLATTLVELARSALPPFGRLVIVNGHGGNLDAIDRALTTSTREGRSVEAWAPTHAEADAHAGWFETSLLLALDPACVRGDSITPGTTTPLPQLLDDLRRDGVKAHSPTGVLGDPTTATTELGERLVADLVADLRSRL